MDPATASAIIAQFKVTYRGVLAEAGYDALVLEDREKLRIFTDTDPATVVDMSTREWWEVSPEWAAAMAVDDAEDAANPQCEAYQGPSLDNLTADEQIALFYKLLGERHPSRDPAPEPGPAPSAGSAQAVGDPTL